MRIAAFITLILASLLAVAAVTPAFAQDERRLALVIGVDDYAFAPLKNPVRDAKLVANALERISFTVTRLDNPSKGQIRLAVDKLYSEARNGSKNATLFVYFAGHGIQIGQENYLIPAKAELQGRSLSYADFEDQAIHAQWLLRKLSETGVTRLIFSLDACRDNPLGKSGELGGGPGLAKMSAIGGGPDTLILFATQPGKTASDGAYNNSPFSEALASTLAVPGQSTQDIIGVVSEKVEGQTRGKQKPYFEGSLRHIFVRSTERSKPGRATSGPLGASLVEQSRIDGPEDGLALTTELLRTRTLADLEQQSLQGDGFASYAAGMAHWDGLGGTPKDIKKAIRFMQIAIKQSSARAANALGFFYCCWEGVARDEDVALTWFEIGANEGSVAAMRNLGDRLTEGEQPRDFDKGLEWLRKAADNWNAQALTDIANLHIRETTRIYDPAKAWELYNRSFTGGYAHAAWFLGNAHRWGSPMTGGRTDLDRGMGFYIDGANAGCTSCWAMAADILNDPKNAERYDPEGALALYKSGGEAGDLEARIEYGNLVKKGAGSIAADPVSAFQAYRSAAEAGSLDGRRAAAIALSRGEGTARDIKKAAVELRELLQNDRNVNLNKRHAIYEPNYWGLARDLILGLRSGELVEAYPGEEAALKARYGSPDGIMKRFTASLTCGSTKTPIDIYIVDWDRPDDETIEGQAAWLKQMRGCDIPKDVVDRFRNVKKTAREKQLLFTEQAVNAFGAAPNEASEKK